MSSDAAPSRYTRRDGRGTEARAAAASGTLVTPEGGTGTATRTRARAWALILAGYLIAALAITWRLWVHPSSATVAGNPSDASQFAWFLRYEATAILHGRLPSLVTTAMNAPQGISMMWNTTILLPGILLAPVTALAGPQTSLTALLTIGFGGSAATLCYVLRRYGVSLPAAALGGAVYGFSPALTHAAIGHYQLQFVVLPPLIADAVLRLCLPAPRPLRSGTWLGLLVSAQLFIGEEILAITAIAVVLLVAVLAMSCPRALGTAVRPALTGLAAAAGVAAALTGWAVRAQFFGRLKQTGSAFAPDFFKNDLYGFFTPSSFQLLHTAGSASAAERYQGGAPEYLAYLGAPLILVLIVLAVVFWRQLQVRACVLTLAVLSLFSLGVHPLIDGTVYPHVSLPWSWLANRPVFVSLLPDRMSLIGAGLAAAVLAFGLDLARTRLSSTRLGQHRAVAVVAAIALLAVAPLVPAPLPATPAVPLPTGWSATFSALRLPAGARVLVVPVPTATLDDALRWQADGGQQIALIAGYFEGPAWNGHAYIEGNGLPSLAYYLDDLWAGTNPPSAPPTAAQVAADLAYWKPAAVVADAAPRPVVLRYLEQLFGPPATIHGSMVAWRLAHQ